MTQNTHETTIDIRESYLEALDESTDTDCITMSFEKDGEEFCLEFAAFTDGRFFNLCDLPRDLSEQARELVAETDLQIDGTGKVYVCFETETDDIGDLLEETEDVLELMEASIEDIYRVEHRQLQTFGPVLDRIHGLIGRIGQVVSA